ncbi:MAG: APC family permease [Planctomycetaceae bacterium]
MTDPDPEDARIGRSTLGVWDAVSLLVGIVVGTAIFKAPAMVFSGTHSPLETLVLWLGGGLIALAGAFCYAELAAAYPRSGGDYEYLSRAYGRWLGLQFVLAQLLIVLTGSVGSMAYAFADYCRELLGLESASVVWLALASILGLTVTNLLGLRAGRWTQNGLTLLKLAGLGTIVVIGLTQGNWEHLTESSADQPRNIGLAMVMIFYAYSGWTHAAYVAAEVDQPQRSLPRALLVGVLAVTAIYLLVNLAFVLVLGFDSVRTSNTPAADLLSSTLGESGARLVSLLVMLSALGAINGTILTGAFLLAELGQDYRQLAWLKPNSTIATTPLRPLLLLSLISCGLVLAVGTESGRQMIDRGLGSLGLPVVPWAQYFGGFDTLVAASAPLFWGFLLLTGTTVFILRYRDPEQPRPFRTPGYPFTPLLFCAASLYMLDASLRYAGSLAWIGIVPITVAALISWQHGAGRSRQQLD